MRLIALLLHGPRVCLVVASFSLWGCYADATKVLPCHLGLENFALQEMQDDRGEELKKMLHRRHDGPNISLHGTQVLVLFTTNFDK